MPSGGLLQARLAISQRRKEGCPAFPEGHRKRLLRRSQSCPASFERLSLPLYPGSPFWHPGWPTLYARIASACELSSSFCPGDSRAPRLTLPSYQPSSVSRQNCPSFRLLECALRVPFLNQWLTCAAARHSFSKMLSLQRRRWQASEMSRRAAVALQRLTRA